MKTVGEEALDLFGKMLKKAIKNPEAMPDRVVMIALSEQASRQVLTPKRLELLGVLRKRKPSSVKDAAKLVKRRVDAVSRDLKILENHGFLEFIQSGKIKTPKVEKDAILIPITG